MWVGQEPAPPVVEWVQYGVLGAVLIALIFGWLWAKPAVDRLLQDKDRIIAERNEQIDILIVEVRELRREVADLTEQVRRRDP